LGTVKKKVENQKIHIKYMVSLRCIMVVKEELRELGITFANVNLGEVELLSKISSSQREALRLSLKKSVWNCWMIKKVS
jgi:hypothetical protein